LAVKRAVEKAVEIAVEKAIDQEKIETVNELYKNGASVDLITKSMKISIERVKQILNIND